MRDSVQNRSQDCPRISVLIPAYNHERYVEGCVRSVLAQDWPNIELLVVDDGSTDATWGRLQSLKGECERRLARVEMATQENRGTSFTWARLRGMVRGNFVMTLASDDELASGALSALVKPMLKDRRIGAVVGQNAFIDGEGRICYWNCALETVYDEKDARYRSLNEAICEWAGVKQFSRQFGDYGRLLRDNYIANGCLIRASELAAVEFPAERVPLEDYWVHLQLSKRTHYKAIPETTFRYRWHAANTSHAREKMKEMTRRIYDFEERRLKDSGDQLHLAVFNDVRFPKCYNLRIGVKKKYDLVFGVGPRCCCAQSIREAKLQFLSLPFDWCGPLGDDDMPGYVDVLCDDFSHWFDKGDFSFFSHNEERATVDVYVNKRTNYCFPHDFRKGVPFDEEYALLAEKYARRVERFRALLKAAKRVLLVRVDSPIRDVVTTAEACVRVRERLLARYPGVDFDVIYFTIDRSRPYDRRLEETVAPGVLHVAFDYVSHVPGAPTYLIEPELTAAVLSAHAQVRDYRTPQERRDYERKRHAARWAKLGTTTFWGYQLARLKKAFGK